jgi:UDPglucose 6-dehydrogenase
MRRKESRARAGTRNGVLKGTLSMSIGIVGYGVVGRHLAQIFELGNEPVIIYDKYLEPYSGIERKEEINSCRLVFLAVPTPAGTDGSCDISAVEEAVSWISSPMCIKSTIPPGTTDALRVKTRKPIVFSPEYVGETPFHKYRTLQIPELVVVGGESEICSLTTAAYRNILGPEPQYFETSAVTAELSKYMENCFFATKVSYVAQFFQLAEHFGADFTQMREIWVADSRVGRSHSTIINGLGFGGRCLPKDLSAIISQATKLGAPVQLLKAIQSFNESVRNPDKTVSTNGVPTKS